jgi:hypothetical protein
MNARVGLELLAKDSEWRYALTPESATFLVSGKPSFHGGFFHPISEQRLPKWKMHEIVRTGRPAQPTAAEEETGPCGCLSKREGVSSWLL